MERTLKPLQDNWDTLLLVLTAQASQEEIDCWNKRIETCINVIGSVAHHEPILEGACVEVVWSIGGEKWTVIM